MYQTPAFNQRVTRICPTYGTKKKLQLVVGQYVKDEFNMTTTIEPDGLNHSHLNA
jgi:hypothetical protein